MAASFRFFRRRRQPKGGATPQSAFFSPLGSQAGEPFFAPAQAVIQAKLTVNQPGDAHEQEADKMAEHVVQRAALKPDEQPVQRKGKSEDDDMAHRKPEREEEKPVQKQPNGVAAAPAAPALAHRLGSTKGQGSALPAGTLHEMSQAFGHDFRNVRIHTGSEAERLSHSLQAQAFTHGQDVYFNAGKYNPEATDGKRLLAHELTHVVQQGAADPQQVQRYPVPGALPCREVVPWLDAHSPYAPEWAETRCQYSFSGNASVRFDTLPGGRVRATVSGSPRVGVAASCPIDSPSWAPTPREHRADEAAAWRAMKSQLTAHEHQHRRLGAQDRAAMQASYRGVSFQVTGADRADAGQQAQARLAELQQQWVAAAQAAQDAIDPFRGARLDCP